MNFPDPFKKRMTTIVIHRPYDARADAQRYIDKLKRADEGMILPAVGVEIRRVDAMQKLRDMEELLKYDFSPLHEQMEHLKRELSEALENGIEVALYEVGVDPDALKHTARLNEELLREVKTLRAENQELKKQLQRAAGTGENTAEGDVTMTETKIKLKRCPCCGGIAAVRNEQKPMEDADGNFSEFTIWKVACLACGLSTAWALDRESVARRWNIRT